ncbi:MAG: TetR/AcrR family transcriptional regulator C-terminal domain-containing protein [Clostridia bacterium]|nr:TetR/AcrR family transcriptional regulator C-terminal domain-containing protein [Clostridia bacterium]
MKRKTAKDILADSFREIAQNKPVDKITIREIAQNCGYSSATFYRQFKDKYDLIVWDYTRDHREIMNRLEQPDYDWRQLLLDNARYFDKHRDYFANLLLHTGGFESFIRNMTEIHFESLKSQVIKGSCAASLDENTEMVIRLYCQGSICLTCEWIMGKYTATPEELANIYEIALPLPLRQVLE